MKIKLIATVVASLLGVYSTSFAAQTETTSTTTKNDSVNLGGEVSQLNNAISENPNHADVEDSRSAEDIVTDNIDEFLKEHPNKDGSRYTSGMAIMSFDPTDSNYGDSLQLKYIEAVSNAQAEFIASVNQEITDKVVSKSVSNQGTDAYKFDDVKPLQGTQAATQAKVDALKDSEVDADLKAKGLNPDDYQSPKEKRKILAQVELTTETMTKAYGDLVGLIPIKTFFEQKNGQGAVGVILRYSPKIRTLFEAIKRGETPMIVGSGGKSPRDLFIDKSGYDLFPEFGVRLGFDENNKPYILSYGQGTYTGPKVPGQSGASFAYKQAELLAKRNVAQAMAGSMNTSEMMRMAQQSAVTLIKNETTGQEAQKTTNEISKQITVSMESRASASIKGLTQVKRWSYKIPGTSNKIYGVVYEWTPEFAQDSSDILNYDYDTAKKKYAPKSSVTSNPDENSTNTRVSRESQDNPHENEW